jgi:hypothetical protein
MQRRATVCSILGLSMLSSFGCGATPSDDAGLDAGTSMDATMQDADASDAAVSDAAALDAGLSDAAPSDAAPSDAAPSDAAPSDAGSSDAGMEDAGVDAGPADAGFVIPGSCTSTPECGPSATCAAGLCVCNAGSLPCGTTCCALTYAREVTLAAAGHSPEIGADAAGNVSVLFEVGSSSVRLATLPVGSTTATTETVTTSSGEEDDADLAVAPDGTLLLAVHQPGVGRSGAFTLFTRAPAASSFTTSSLRPGPPDVFAYDAAVSISRAPGGDMYAGASARSGDGTQGLAMARFDATAGAWSNLPTLYTTSAYSRSELFARDDGFFVGLHDFPNAQDFYQDYDTGGTALALLEVAVSVSTRGQSAAALGDDDVLNMFTGTSTAGRLDRSDGGLGEAVPFSGPSAGAHSDIDMALDRDGNPALVVHSSTNHSISLIVRMPTGGFTRTTWFDASFLPPSTTSSWMTLDLERLPNGNLAIVIGDSMDRGELHYRELGR